jgi:hypothetical protein
MKDRSHTVYKVKCKQMQDILKHVSTTFLDYNKKCKAPCWMKTKIIRKLRYLCVQDLVTSSHVFVEI